MSSMKRKLPERNEDAKRKRSTWMIFPGADALRPYNIVFDYDRFEYELAVGLDFALANALEPEEIVGACNFNGEIVYFFKWKRQVAVSYITSEHAANLYSEAIIKFHEKYNWKIVDTATSQQQHGGNAVRPVKPTKGFKNQLAYLRK
ncbi:uncharacterized protein LOC132935544 [Metopolophium dirhodum]|uniref:uncharacterized protein LOC132935544 n=1 Tax=Metopolophium dirhodum TaxID=44670 RepID=UPI00298F614D|nr:uncharacterized protein LOC132935544 [Metopolophium dirhodum]